jgi:hypothetical protein
MPKGKLEYDPSYITPRDPAKSPEAYSAASEVKDNISPIKNVKRAAEAQSMQEDFEKKMVNETKKRRVGGKSRRRKSKKTKRRSRK